MTPVPGRQLHSLENANRRARNAALDTGVNVHVDGIYLSDPLEPTKKATLVPSRDFTAHPKVRMSCTYDGDELDGHADPDNIVGTTYAQCLPVVTETSHFASFLAAFNKRSNHMQPKGMGKAEFNEAMDIIREIPDGLFEAWDENDEDWDRWMAKFDESKKRDMLQGREELQDATPYYLGTKDLQVKRESLWNKRSDPNWAPRIIYAGNRAFNAVTGAPAMVVMERMVALTSDDDHARKVGPLHVKFAYKTDDVSIGKFLLKDPSCTHTREGDFGCNDMYQTEEVALLYDAFLKKLGMPEWYRTLLIQMEEYRVKSRHFEFTATLKFQLPTGTTSTTPRNSFYNMIMFAVSCRRQRVSLAYVVILGDDILARLAQALCIASWSATVTLFGMKLKGSSPELHAHATLLSRRFIVRDGYAFCMPDYTKFVSRYNIRATLNQQLTDTEYMAGKALSYAYEFRHVPLIRDKLLDHFKSLDVPIDSIQTEDLSWFTKTSGIRTPADLQARIKNETVLATEDETLMFFLELYDLDPRDIDSMLDILFYGDQFAVEDEYTDKIYYGTEFF